MTLPTAINPWKIHAKEVIFENPWLKLVNYKTSNPKGHPVDYGVVRFKNRAIGVVPYDNGNVWMVGQTRFALGRYSWEIPEGGCLSDENLEDCARRELLEETGITAKTLTPMFQIHLSNSITDEWGQVFLAQGLHFGASNLDDSEDISVRKIPLDDLYDYVERGEITDSLSVTAIYKLKLMQLSGQIL